MSLIKSSEAKIALIIVLVINSSIIFGETAHPRLKWVIGNHHEWIAKEVKIFTDSDLKILKKKINYENMFPRKENIFDILEVVNVEKSLHGKLEPCFLVNFQSVEKSGWTCDLTFYYKLGKKYKSSIKKKIKEYGIDKDTLQLFKGVWLIGELEDIHDHQIYKTSLEYYAFRPSSGMEYVHFNIDGSIMAIYFTVGGKGSNYIVTNIINKGGSEYILELDGTLKIKVTFDGYDNMMIKLLGEIEEQYHINGNFKRITDAKGFLPSELYEGIIDFKKIR